MHLNLCGLLFSKKVRNSIKASIESVFSVKELGPYDKHLGNPTLLERRRIESFEFLIDRIIRA